MYRQSEKKLVKQQYLLHCSHNMVNFSPIVAEIVLPVWSTPKNFNGFRVLASLLHRRRSTDVNQTLNDVWPSPGLVHYIYIFGGSRPLTEFRYVQNSQQRGQPNFAAWYREWNYGTFAEGATYIRLGGHHVRHRPTF